MHKYFVLFALAVALLPGVTAALDADSLFNAANRLYEDADYKGALNGYLKLEENNYQSASLYFNTGNCFFKEGELGYAILYYLRAQKITPGDEEIKSNLEFARQFLPTIMEGVRINPVSGFFDSLAAPFTLNGIAWTSSIFFVVFMLLLSARLYYRFHGLMAKIATYLAVVLLLASSGLTTYKYRTEYLTRRGVIVAPEAKILSGPGGDNEIEFTGGSGLTFEIQKEVDEYYQVIFENKRKGWISKVDASII